MKSYIDLIKTVVDNGGWKSNRTGIDTLAYPCAHFRHDMKDGFPLLTTKKMPLSVVAVEVEGYIKGITSKKWYQDRGCHIWDQWANPKKVKARYDEVNGQAASDEVMGLMSWEPTMQELALMEDDLGPLYGYQGRHFGQVYDENCDGVIVQCDQLKTIVATLKSNPTDRRMVCSYWCPYQLDQMALPPCIVLWNINVGADGRVNLSWHQRSADLALGVPFDIAHHALLLEILAKTCGRKAGILSAQFHDLHIYKNHLEDLVEQGRREPRPLPDVEILKDDIFEWTYRDFELNNYQYWPRIKFGEVAV